MISFVVEAIRERCASFRILTAAVPEICGGQTNVPILDYGSVLWELNGREALAVGSFHVKSSGDFHGPPPILLKFGTLVGIV